MSFLIIFLYVLPVILLFAILSLTKIPMAHQQYDSDLERYSELITVCLMLFVFVMTIASTSRMWFFFLEVLLVPLLMSFNDERVRLRKFINQLLVFAFGLAFFIILNKFWFRIGLSYMSDNGQILLY